MIGRVKSVGAAIAACGIALAIGSPLAAFAQDEQTNQSSGEQTGHHHHGPTTTIITTPTRTNSAVPSPTADLA